MATNPDWPRDVLSFWFGELTPADWFSGGAAVDERIRERFAAVHAQVATSAAGDLIRDPETARAAIIVLDQVSRHIHRGTAYAFASDAIALEIARHVVAQGWDIDLGVDERAFIYLPFEHSEDPATQDRSVELFATLDNERYADYAERHREVIRRFGRFPHRNAALGRSSTAEEQAYLADGGGF